MPSAREVSSAKPKTHMRAHGSYLGMEKGCFVLKHRRGITERYPLFENPIGEVVLRTRDLLLVQLR